MRETINNKIQLLEENLEKLKELQRLSANEFLNDFRNVEAAKHLLQTSIEAMIDIANSIIAYKRLREPDTSAESFEILADNELISDNNKARYINMTKFRNRVVHVYGKIDEKDIYNIVKDYLDDYRLFIKEITNRI